MTSDGGGASTTATYPRQADLWSLGLTGFLTWPAEGSEPARRDMAAGTELFRLDLSQ